MGLMKSTWIWIHSRAGILMMTFTVIHLFFHWKWIIYATKNFFGKEKKISNCEESTITDKINN